MFLLHLFHVIVVQEDFGQVEHLALYLGPAWREEESPQVCLVFHRNPDLPRHDIAIEHEVISNGVRVIHYVTDGPCCFTRRALKMLTFVPDLIPQLAARTVEDMFHHTHIRSLPGFKPLNMCGFHMLDDLLGPVRARLEMLIFYSMLCHHVLSMCRQVVIHRQPPLNTFHHVCQNHAGFLICAEVEHLDLFGVFNHSGG